MLSENEKVSPCYTRDLWPALAEPRTFRVFLCKKGDAQYFSHLDLQRMFQRVLVRAGIPMWYTQGFNPHPKVVFALPLSVGCESVCEFIDLRINRDIPCEAVKDQLNAELTDDMRVLEVYPAKRPFTDMGWADYTLEICWPGLRESDIDTIWKKLTVSPCLINKHTKSGEKTVDVVPMIRQLKIQWGENGRLTVKARLSASSVEYLNPESLVQVIREELGFGPEDPVTEWHSIMRTETYCADGVTVFR